MNRNKTNKNIYLFVIIQFYIITLTDSVQLKTLVMPKSTKEPDPDAPRHVTTPCANYNQLHTEGDVNCLECTGIRFNADYGLDGEFVYGRYRDGSVYPMKRFVRPLQSSKRAKYTCMWCPETQTCGHPIDSRIFCPSDQGGPDPNSGFVSHLKCYDNFENTNQRVEEAQYAQNQKATLWSDKKRLRVEEDYRKQTKFNIRLGEREGAHLDWRHSTYQCLGECMKQGVSSCSIMNRKQLTRESNELDPRSDLVKMKNAPISGTNTIPCSMTIPYNTLVPRRVLGVFSPGRNDWIVCRLVECPLPPPPHQSGHV